MLAGAIGACIAEAVTIPIDQAKVRLQLQTGGVTPGMKPYTGMVSTIYRIGSEESVGTLYRGLTPGMHRQFANCSVRFGAYESVRENSLKSDIGAQLDRWTRRPHHWKAGHFIPPHQGYRSRHHWRHRYLLC